MLIKRSLVIGVDKDVKEPINSNTKGGKLSLQLPVLGTDGFFKGGQKVWGANLVKLNLSLGVGKKQLDNATLSALEKADSNLLNYRCY